MTARIQKNFDFNAGVYFNGAFFINNYAMTVNFVVNTEQIPEQNVALDRLKFFINECLMDSVLIHEQQREQIRAYQAAGLRVTTLPEEPYDQVLCIALLCKMNAISQGKLVIEEIGLNSVLGDEVTYLHNIEEDTGPFVNDGWWSDAEPTTNNVKPRSTAKVVKLTQTNHTWSDAGLNWASTADRPETEANAETKIVFAKFGQTHPHQTHQDS